jgi:hypothetical protein
MARGQSIEETNAMRTLERLDPPKHSGVIDAERPCRSAQRSAIGNSQDKLEVGPIHSTSRHG